MVAELILSGLEAPVPNVSHVLLGCKQQSQRQCGISTRVPVAIQPETLLTTAANFSWNEDSCYRAIVDRVTQDFLSDRRRPRLAGLCYRILFTLCRQPVTSTFVHEKFRNCISLRETSNSTNFWLVHLRAVLDRACNQVEENVGAAKHSRVGMDNAPGARTIHGEDRVMPWVVQGATLEIFQGARSAVPMRDTIVQFLDMLYSDNATDELHSGAVADLPSSNTKTTQQHRMRIIELLERQNLSQFFT